MASENRLAGFLTLLLIGQSSYGIPLRGNYPWSVILCKYYDNLYEPQNREYFFHWLFDEQNDGSLSRFFNLASNGLYNINGSAVHGWITMPYRKQATKYLADKDPHLNILYPSPGAVPLKVYHKIKQLCIETARNEGLVLQKNIITVINDDNVAMFCSQEGILLTPQTLATSALAHEMVHSFHIGHSYSDRNVQVFPYSNFGEYDDLFDLMSTSNAYMHRTTYGMSGPGLNGPHLEYLGWLPMDRVLVFGKDGQNSATFTLASISVPHTQSEGVLMIQIPYDRDNRMVMLTVTLRTPDGIDSGVPGAAILIHRLKEVRGHMFSYLVTNDQSWRHEWYAGEKFIVYLKEAHDMSIRVEVLSIDPVAKTAQVHIISTFSPTRCLSNEVNREATEDDEVCVHYKEVDKIVEENRLAWTHTSLSGKCRDGFHKRLATPEDQVCVAKDRTREVRAQNAIWKFYQSFYDQPTWGLNSCEDGSLWRTFDSYDYVCIDTPRKEAYDAEKPTKWGNCEDKGLKGRHAFSKDRACIDRSDDHEYYLDYYHGQYRLQYRKFFNGIDVVD